MFCLTIQSNGPTSGLCLSVVKREKEKREGSRKEMIKDSADGAVEIEFDAKLKGVNLLTVWSWIRDMNDSTIGKTRKKFWGFVLINDVIIRVFKEIRFRFDSL